MLQHPAAVRAAFEEGASCFMRTLHAIEPHQWELPGLGEWTVRELVAHTLRSFSTIETYLSAEPTVDGYLAEATDYYRAVLGSGPGLHEGVAKRGRDAGALLTDPIGESEVTVQRVLALVASTADDDPVNTFVGQIVFSEYLASRVVELGVHTLDLQHATGQPMEVPAISSSVMLSVLTSLGRPTTLLLALTGRQPLPPDFNVLS